MTNTAPCLNLGCSCRPGPHGCHRGWRDRDLDPADRYIAVTPCSHCRPQLTEILDAIPPPGQRTVIDLARFRTHRERKAPA